MALSRFLNRLIRVGRLTVVDHDGSRTTYGPGGGPEIVVRFSAPGVGRHIARNPSLGTGEAYTEGQLHVEDGGDLFDFLDLVGCNSTAINMVLDPPPARLLRRLMRRMRQFNPTNRAQRNVAHHYDLSGDLYRLFLDDDRQYSCAHFDDPTATLEDAQARKKCRLAAKLLVEPGMAVLDIGSGWGGLALTLAAECGASVTGLTLSVEQLGVAADRARRAELAGRARFFLRDYREETGRYDRIVSVGMFEHVGLNCYDTFFRQVRDRLTDDGIAVLHTIGRAGGPGYTDAWIQRYIFPGGYIPALSEMLPAIERTGLWVTDVEVLRLHYAETLRHWRRRFLANRERAVALYDERFARMWEYYLAVSEISFRYLDNVVFQIQMARRRDAVPLDRGYIEERAARLSGRAVAPPDGVRDGRDVRAARASDPKSYALRRSLRLTDARHRRRHT